MMQDITALLPALQAGDAQARDKVVQYLYSAMRELADAQLRAEHGPRTLSTTELVSESFLRLFDASRLPEVANRQHMLGFGCPHDAAGVDRRGSKETGAHAASA